MDAHITPGSLASTAYYWLVDRLAEKSGIRDCSDIIKRTDLTFYKEAKKGYPIRFNTLSLDQPIFYDKCLKSGRFLAGRAFNILAVVSYDKYTSFMDLLDTQMNHSCGGGEIAESEGESHDKPSSHYQDSPSDVEGSDYFDDLPQIGSSRLPASGSGRKRALSVSAEPTVGPGFSY